MRLWVMRFCLVVVVAGICAGEEPGGAGPGIFGALQNDPARAGRNHAAGLRMAVIEVGWNRYEPRRGEWDAGYVAEVKAKMAALRAAGMELMLDLGMQYPPGWVRELPNGRFVNQFGKAYNEDGKPGAGGVNAVFNAAIRGLQAAYVRRVLADLGGEFAVVRLGWGYYGEVGYPGARFGGENNCYWGFDDLAQGKAAGLAEGVAVCPVPGWRPGNVSADHRDAKAFAEWYLESLRNYHDWQIATVRKVYGGKMAMLYPSWGIRPGQVEAAVAGDLGGGTPAERNGEVQRGFDFARMVGGIKDAREVKDARVIVYCTWLDAKEEYGDDASADPARWCPMHYLAELARRNRPELEVWGENTGNGSRRDMELCFGRMRAYGVKGLMWAFEGELYDGRHAGIGDYAEMIAEYRAAR